MKNVFVTVGTTRFDSLIEFIDKNISKDNYKIIMQISDGRYKPKEFESFEYTNNVDEIYNNSDIIITHAGAGSIYKLLELRKKIVIVPNLERKDSHQSDIANYMNANKYALVCNSFEDLSLALEKIQIIELKPFEKAYFFKTAEILEYCLS
jgi:beta-1,4-N-acetylglucosaminyltransferase